MKNRFNFALLKLLPLSFTDLVAKRRPRAKDVKRALNQVTWSDLTEFVFRVSTDGLSNPLSKVYSKSKARKLFDVFSQVDFNVRGTHGRFAKRFPGIYCYWEEKFGWFLYMTAIK